MKIAGTYVGLGSTNSGPTPNVEVQIQNLGYGSHPVTTSGCNGTYAMGNWQTPTQTMQTINLDPMENYSRTVEIPVYWQATGYMTDPQGGNNDSDTDRTEL